VEVTQILATNHAQYSSKSGEQVEQRAGNGRFLLSLGMTGIKSDGESKGRSIFQTARQKEQQQEE
jgi:hypothetical protein